MSIEVEVVDAPLYYNILLGQSWIYAMKVIVSSIFHVIWFPYHVDFLFHVECVNNMIKHTVVDEGVATSVMSLACWKGLGSPTLSRSMTMLNSFYGHSFQLHGIIPSLQVQLGGKTVSIKVEVANAPHDYNLFTRVELDLCYESGHVFHFSFHLLPF